MKMLRIAVAVALAACVAPMLSMLVAAAVAKHNGCTLHEGFANPCVVAGVDIGTLLYNMAVMGWLMLFTLPLAALVVLVWLVAEIVAALRRRRAKA